MSVPNLKISSSPLPSSLCHMPDDILYQITEHVAAFSRHESEQIQKLRFIHLIRQGDLGKTKSLWAYEQPDAPMLNSLQALSSVNKQMNQLCRPLLWRALRFPSLLPIPMRVWNGLLDKYGPDVRSLTILLSKDWLGVPAKRPFCLRPRKPIQEKKDRARASISERDNLLTRHVQQTGHWNVDWHEGLSRENVFRLVSQSPNLTALRLTYANEAGALHTSLNQVRISRLQLNLASLIRHADGLRHLEIEACLTTLPASLVINLIKLLPSLESLGCAGISSSAPDDVKNFAIALSELKHLRRLVLRSVEALDFSLKDYYPEAPKISHLTIRVCDKLWASQTPSLVSIWTPHLTHLTLQTSSFMAPAPFLQDFLNFNPNQHQFYLPLLTHLTLSHDSNCDYLRCFQRCKELRHLTYLGLEEEPHATFLEFVASTFPRLELLSLDQTHYFRIRVADKSSFALKKYQPAEI